MNCTQFCLLVERTDSYNYWTTFTTTQTSKKLGCCVNKLIKHKLLIKREQHEFHKCNVWADEPPNQQCGILYHDWALMGLQLSHSTLSVCLLMTPFCLLHSIHLCIKYYILYLILKYSSSVTLFMLHNLTVWTSQSFIVTVTFFTDPKIDF